MTVAKLVRLDGLEHFEELRRALLQRGLIVRVGVANSLDVLSEVTKQEGVFLSNVFGDLNIGPIDGTEEKGTIQAELHVAGPRGFSAGSTDLDTDVRSGDQHFSDRNAVVGNEANAKEIADVGVLVDDLGNVHDETNDKLCNVVAGRGFAGENGSVLDKLLALFGRRLLNLEIAMNDTEDVESLALVLVKTLDLASEHAVDVDIDAQVRLEYVGKTKLVLDLDVTEHVTELLVIGHGQ